MLGQRLFFSRRLVPWWALNTLVLLLLLFFLRDVLAGDVAAGDLQGRADSSSSVHSLLSGLSDEQVRQLLITELQQNAAVENLSLSREPEMRGLAAPLAEILTSLNEESFQSGNQLRKLLTATPSLLPDLYKIFISLSPFETLQGAIKNIFWILFFVSIGLLIELMVKRFVGTDFFQVDTKIFTKMNQTDRLKAGMSYVLPDIIGLCLFFSTSYGTFFIFEPTNSPVVQLCFLAVLITIALVRTVSILLYTLISPEVRDLRLLHIDCQTARSIYRLMMIFMIYIISALMFSVVIFKLGAEQHNVLLLQFFTAMLLLLIMAIIIIIYKNRVRDYIYTGAYDDQQSEGWVRRQFASTWHILAILYLGLLFFLLLSDVASPDRRSNSAFLLSFFVLPIWIVIDKISQWVVLQAMSTLKIHQVHYDDIEEASEEILHAREKGKKLYQKMKSFARAAVTVALVIWLASFWKIEVPYISKVAAVLMDGFIIMTLALVFWRFITSWIENKIKETSPEEEEEKETNGDGEWGSAASRERSYTLLPMVRKFIASVLVVMVTMTIVSSMGVDIGPLLAGAGVIGLAVGFGAQKLVSDMFSGFFYLIDDAFRVGEYITAGSVSGTVESITLRNVMLRHHRGMLQIVPHSELGAITNFMRGGIVIKFNLDFPYDADIDKIRKIIKKVGIAMLKDEEMGEDFIQPVKSQGVREITNSVMTIRVKFTAKPGTQFVIRREAYRRITESLKRSGIHYAHKKVIVEVPGVSDEGDHNTLTEEQAKTISNTVGAAAHASINEEEGKGTKALNFPQ